MDVIDSNHDLVDKLKTKQGLVYKVMALLNTVFVISLIISFSQNPFNRAQPDGLFTNEIILKIIKDIWFDEHTADGVVHKAYFKDGIPLKTIALVLAAVRALHSFLSITHT